VTLAKATATASTHGGLSEASVLYASLREGAHAGRAAGGGRVVTHGARLS